PSHRNQGHPPHQEKGDMKFRYCSANRGSSIPTADCMTVNPRTAITPSKINKGQSNASKAVTAACQSFLITWNADQGANNQNLSSHRSRHCSTPARIFY